MQRHQRVVVTSYHTAIQSEVWWCHVLSHRHVANSQWYDTVLSGCLTTVAGPMSDQQSRCCTMSACPHVLQCLLGKGPLVTRERALGTHDPSYIPRPAKFFFIPQACGLQRAARFVAALEPSQTRRRGPKPRGI
jgi:hypothetical protein